MSRLFTQTCFISVDIDTGVAVIRKRPNEHPLAPHWSDLFSVSVISMLSYDTFQRNKHELMRMMSFQDMKHWMDEEEYPF